MLRFAEEMDEQIVASIIAAASALVANTGAIAQQHNENFINFVTEAAAVDSICRLQTPFCKMLLENANALVIF
jgi:hypothetical protein